MRSKALLLCAFLTSCSELPSWMGGSPVAKPKHPGERAEVLSAAEAMQPDDAIASVEVSLPETVLNATWPLPFNVNAANNSHLTLTGIDKTDSTSMGEGNAFSHILVTRPVIADDTVYVMDAVGIITAHDAKNIDKKRWDSSGLSEEDQPDILGGGLGFDRGQLYAVSGRGAVGAFDAKTGKQLWRISLGVPLRSAPKIADNFVLAISIDNQLFALNSTNGDILWTHRGISETKGLMRIISPAVSSGVVIVPYSSGDIYALSLADGSEIWRESLELPAQFHSESVFGGVGGDPVLDGDVVMAVGGGGMMSVFAQRDGKRVWSKPLSSYNTPWVSGGFVFMITSDNTLVAMLKYTGQVRWAMKLPRFEDETLLLDPIVWSGPVLASGQLFVVSSTGILKSIDPKTGSLLQDIDVPKDIFTAPVIAGGRMYLVNRDAQLYSVY